MPAPGTAANAIGRHSVMIAVDPATMEPMKKIRPNTKKLGIGNASNRPGNSVITFVCQKVFENHDHKGIDDNTGLQRR